VKYFVSSLMLFAVISLSSVFSALAQESAKLAQEPPKFDETFKAWEKLLVENSEILEQDVASDKEFEEKKTVLRDIRDEATSSVARQKTQMKKQQDVLAALGEVPEDEAQEDEAIRERREKLNNEISVIDGRLKQSKLVIARVDAQIAAIEQVQDERLKNKLLARETPPLALSGLTTFFSELYQFVTADVDWRFILLHLFVVGALAYLSRPMTRSLNEMFESAPSVEVRAKLKPSRVIVVSLAAYLVFLMRFDLIAMPEGSVLENACEALSAICLSVVLFLALRKIRFVHDIFYKSKEFERVPKDYSWLYNTAKTSLRLVLAVVPVAVLFGYINLGLYLSFNIYVSLIVVLLFVWSRAGLVLLGQRFSQQVDGETEAEKKEALSPMFITIIEPLLALLSLLIALFFWGMTAEDLTTWANKYSSGIPIGDMTIDFVSIGSAIMLFFVLYMVMKVIQWFLSSRVFPYTTFDIGVKDAILAITGYVGIVVAFLASMGALGIDMSKLAIIAGALSVGIGFGLQAIFSNFVSGLILLFERPVKVGDWVVVGENQGMVKKIRVRSTEIETFWNSSIIVPNSQLISEVVTNWTLHDRMGRVDVQVGVAYGSDTAKVKELLLKVAAGNSNVRRVPAPTVLFQNFGDSSLDFELRCFIRNIRDIYRVTSDIRFAIDDAFREHGIEIPFPQRDIHIIKGEGELET